MKHIFTTPTSAEYVDLPTAADTAPSETAAPPPGKKRKGKSKTPSKGTVAGKLHMTRVTPRAVAYTCVMVLLYLTLWPVMIAHSPSTASIRSHEC